MIARKPELSIIVATYNRPNSLRLCLEGFARQTDTDFEMIIADDGSDPDTPAMVEEFRRQAPFPIIFVTQSHTIFHKTRVVNKAFFRSSSDNLLFCDGDCVPFHDFVAIHKESLKPGCFCVGGYLHLTVPQSRRVTVDMIQQRGHETLADARVYRRLRRNHRKNLFYGLLRTKNRPRIMGGNFSVTRADFVRVNGFDERYKGFGAEDSDIRNRLRNNGCRGICLWIRAFTCHLDHNSFDPPRPGKPQTRARRNKEMYYASRRNLRAVEGLDGHAEAP